MTGLSGSGASPFAFFPFFALPLPGRFVFVLQDGVCTLELGHRHVERGSGGRSARDRRDLERFSGHSGGRETGSRSNVGQVGRNILHNGIVSVEEGVFKLLVIVAKALPDLGVHGEGLAEDEDFAVLLQRVPSGSLHQHVSLLCRDVLFQVLDVVQRGS